MIYEYYRDGVRVDRVQPKPDGYDDTRIGLAVMEREASGARDGWYRDGEYRQAQAAAAQVTASTVAEVLDDVGDDPAKALAALRAEMANDKPRKSLVAKLQALAEPLLVDADADDYDATDEPVLDELLVQRGLPTDGNKAEKVMRLRAHDMEQAAAESVTATATEGES